ncbi:radical SAM protein [Bacillus infantis]|uniref:radical SAM protein n=1 Tax=Bacillus infantis TaxID=324767 RepID=UPI0020A0423C|nr:radical SAM protein [Bacillus infantis]MCP1161331.1 radical SAM protein [Bacillus infantis]
MKKGMTPLSVVDRPKVEFEEDKVLFTGRAQRFQNSGYSEITRENFLEISPAPWSVDFQFTAVCNQHCVFCSYEDRNKHLMKNSYDLITRTHKELIEMGTRGLIYTGGGEPLSWINEGKTLKDIVAETNYGPNTKPSLVTNGVMLNKILEKEIISKFHFISVSVYAHNEEIFKNVVKVNSFKNQINNIKRLIAMKKEYNMQYPEIQAKILINRENYKYLPEIYDFCKYELGPDHISMRCVNNFEESQDVELSDEQQTELKMLVESKLNINEDYVADFLNSLLPPKKMQPASQCWTIQLGHNLLISTLGEVYIEIPYGANKEYCIGNLNDQTMKEIWGSEKHLSVINSLNARMQSNGCDLRMCRHHKYNKVLDSYLQGNMPEPNAQDFDLKHGYYL